MKKLLFLFVLFVGVRVNAQVSFPSSSDSAHWVQIDEGLSWQNCQINRTLNISCKGDTIISGIKYSTLVYAGNQDCYSAFPTLDSTVCSSCRGIYFKNVFYGWVTYDSLSRKVFIIKNNTIPQLLYDFNLQLNVGDVYPNIFYNTQHSDTIWITNIDSININGLNHRRWVLGGKNGFTHLSTLASIIEGIGSTLGLAEDLTFPFESGSALICFASKSVNHYCVDTTQACFCDITLSENNISLSKPTISISPNPANNIIEVRGLKSDGGSLKMYNVLGEEVLKQSTMYDLQCTIDVSQLANGVYTLVTDAERSSARTFNKVVISR